MRPLSILLAFVLANAAVADTFFVTTVGIWRVANGEPNPTITLVTAPGDNVVIEGSTPAPKPQPPTGPQSFSDRVAGWADLVNSPATRSALAEVYRTAATRPGATWEQRVATVDFLSRVIVQQEPAWESFFTQVDAAMSSQKKNPATLLAIADGLARANALPAAVRGTPNQPAVNWIAVAKCLIEAFLPLPADGASAAPKPDPISLPLPGKITVSPSDQVSHGVLIRRAKP